MDLHHLLEHRVRWIGPAMLFFTCVVGACAKDEGGGLEEDETQGETATEDQETETVATPEFVPYAARGGLDLSHVEVNQGIAVPIAQGSEWVGPADRNGVLLAGRDALIRAHWSYPEDWVEREIEGRLHLKLPSGEEVVHSNVALVDRESYGGTLESTFWWGIPAEDVEQGTEFKVTLWETEEGWEDQSDPVADVWPASGYEQIGFEGTPMELKIVIVPIEYDDGDGCDTETYSDLQDDAFVERFIDDMHERNPVQNVQFTVREQGIDWNGALSSIAQLHEPLQQMRIDDGADPNVYYYGLLDACGGGIDDAAGIAAGIPGPEKGLAYQRVAAGIWLEGHGAAYETYVHEIGHCQGLRHIYCPEGSASGTDDSYPNQTGATDVWGFGIRSFQLKHPTTSKDYMTYCDPTWVSAWTWRKVTERIKILTSWDYETPAPDPDPDARVLIGLLMADGSESWWTTRGTVPEARLDPGTTVGWTDAGGLEVETPAMREVLEDSTIRLTAPIDAGFDAATELFYAEGGARATIDPGTLHRWSRAQDATR